jgi:hypothetical protein
MATKAGRAEIKDIRAGVTLWKAAIDPVTGRRFPQSIFITLGARRMRFPRTDGTYVGMWVYHQRAFTERGQEMSARMIADPMWSPHTVDGIPVFDKLFVSRSAAVRWIKRYESNRIETLCEDRRVFICGSRPMRIAGPKKPFELDLDKLGDHRFTLAEIAMRNHYKAPSAVQIVENLGPAATKEAQLIWSQIEAQLPSSKLTALSNKEIVKEINAYIQSEMEFTIEGPPELMAQLRDQTQQAGESKDEVGPTPEQIVQIQSERMKQIERMQNTRPTLDPADHDFFNIWASPDGSDVFEPKKD